MNTAGQKNLSLLRGSNLKAKAWVQPSWPRRLHKPSSGLFSPSGRCSHGAADSILRVSCKKTRKEAVHAEPETLSPDEIPAQSQSSLE